MSGAVQPPFVPFLLQSQWFMPFEEWSESEPHMPVLSGAGYVLSADMAAFAARESHKPTARHAALVPPAARCWPRRSR